MCILEARLNQTVSFTTRRETFVVRNLQVNSHTASVLHENWQLHEVQLSKRDGT